MNRLEETSKKSKFKQYLFGTKKTIHTFAIGTPENPMGDYLDSNKVFTEEENKERRQAFEKELNDYKIHYFRVKGKFGDEENSYLITNVPLNFCYHIFNKYGQLSFIYGSIEEKDEGEGVLVYKYYEKPIDKKINKTFGTYVLRDTETKIVNLEDAEDFFTAFEDYKFTIPFSIFESAVVSIGDQLTEKYGWNGNLGKILKEGATSNMTLSNFWRFNKTNLLTEEQEAKRLKNIGTKDTFSDYDSEKHTDLYFAEFFKTLHSEKKLKETSKISKFKQYLFGTKRVLITFAIGTPENPNATALTEEENKELRRKFEVDLTNNKLFFKRIKGKYNTEEKSYLIVNINLPMSKYLFKRYSQESFIFASFIEEENSDNLKLIYQYLEFDGNDYQVISTKDRVINADDSEDFYSSFRNFKFSIPFFESALEEIGEKLVETYGWNPNLTETLKKTALSKWTPNYTYKYNRLHLITESQNGERLKDLEKFEKSKKIEKR